MAYDYPMNFSNGTNAVTGLASLIQYGDYVVGGVLGSAFLGLIFLITFAISIAAGVKKALLSSLFITFLFSVYFLRIEMVSPVIVFGLISGVIGLAIFSKPSGGQPY